MNTINEEKLLDLLCKKAATGLDANEAAELTELEVAFPEWKDDTSFETAAAAIGMTAADQSVQMPAALRSRIIADAGSFFESQAETQPGFEFGKATSTGLGLAAEELGIRARSNLRQWFGWGVAALACVALAFNVYLTRYQNPELRAGGEPQAIQAPELTDVQKMEQLQSSGNAITVQFAKADPKKPGDISGDVVWSSSEQKGYMRFRGIPVNDPQEATYQLWIFDEEQNEKYPVDGGVFDVNQDGEVIVPIDAKINIKKPTLFAITKEKPGGVVVSDRTGLIAIAKV